MSNLSNLDFPVNSSPAVNPENFLSDVLSIFPGSKIVNSSAGGPSYTCIDSRFKVPKGKVRILPHRCNSPWCPKCSKGRFEKLSVRLMGWDWRKVRQVMLSVEREKFPDGPESCYRSISESKAVPSMVKNLGRGRGKKVKVVDWVRILQWHKDGFPHWHLLILTDTAGFEGMIGQEKIHRYWPYGGIHESPFKSKNHFLKMAGYLKGHGYLQGEGYQGNLPDWALDADIKIKRIEGKHFMAVRKEKSLDTESEEGKRAMSPKRPYRVILDECGEKTRMSIEFESLCLGWGMIREIHSNCVPLMDGPHGGFGYEIDPETGQFMRGLICEMTVGELSSYLWSHPVLRPIWYELQSEFNSMLNGVSGDS